MRVRLSNYLLVALGLFLFAVAAQAATPQLGYPVPQIIGPTHPSAVVPGSLHFTLDVYGANFINGSVVNWNGSARTTTFLSAHHLRAQINATGHPAMDEYTRLTWLFRQPKMALCRRRISLCPMPPRHPDTATHRTTLAICLRRW